MLNFRPDHFVYVVPDLEAAMESFAQTAGIRPTFGGFHPDRGTKNALVNLSNGCYLEFLAIDHQNENVQPPRWMGADLVTAPTMTRWALKSNDLDAQVEILKRYHPEHGAITGGSRRNAAGNLLKWQMTLPLARPDVELVPFLVDWSASASHPTDNLGEGCEFMSLTMSHPKPETVRPTLEKLGIDWSVNEGKEATLRVHIRTPRGPLTL